MTTPAIIQPHLIPFIYEEFSGKGCAYEIGESKDVLIYRSGSLGQVLFRVCDLKRSSSKLWLKINVVPARLRSHNYAFLSLDGKSVLELEAEDVKMINDLLEDMMSTALVYFVLGHVSGNEKQDLVQKSIEDFMTRYHLFDFEFNVQQLRQMYYRSKTREALLFRFQRRPGQQKVRSLIHVTAASGIQP